MRLGITLVLALLSAGYPWHAACGQETPGLNTIPRRAVPVPAGVSQQLRELIASREVSRELFPLPTTRAEWLELQRTRDSSTSTLNDRWPKQ